MTDGADLPLLDHELAADELAWVQAIYDEFAATRASHADPKDALRAVLEQPRHRLSQPVAFAETGPWRLGENQHGRFAAAVFLPRVELHRHPKSRTDQFAIYVRGEADAFSLDASGEPVLTPVTGGRHFHNAPGAPHAFLPKVGVPVPRDWEIAFIAITPRNLREDTYEVSDPVKAAYRRVAGTDAPAGV